MLNALGAELRLILKMAKLERVYNIPLRKEFLKVANWI